jgi:toxin YoeB
MIEALHWSLKAWDDYEYCQGEDRKTLKRINKLIKDVVRTPFEGFGKPEPLRANLSGYWSRRIDDQNRLVYKVRDNALLIVSCRLHYEK